MQYQNDSWSWLWLRLHPSGQDTNLGCLYDPLWSWADHGPLYHEAVAVDVAMKKKKMLKKLLHECPQVRESTTIWPEQELLECYWVSDGTQMGNHTCIEIQIKWYGKGSWLVSYLFIGPMTWHWAVFIGQSLSFHCGHKEGASTRTCLLE
jgi:hypothetical protein